jgi:hypothetical protein
MAKPFGRSDCRKPGNDARWPSRVGFALQHSSGFDTDGDTAAIFCLVSAS